MICSFCEADLSALDLPDGRCPVCGGVVAWNEDDDNTANYDIAESPYLESDKLREAADEARRQKPPSPAPADKPAPSGQVRNPTPTLKEILATYVRRGEAASGDSAADREESSRAAAARNDLQPTEDKAPAAGTSGKTLRQPASDRQRDTDRSPPQNRPPSEVSMTINPRKLDIGASHQLFELWKVGNKTTPDSGRKTMRTEGDHNGDISQLVIQKRAVRRVGETGGAPPDYELDHVIGEGGVGWVYSARQASIGRTVALKMLKDSVHESQQREGFLVEAVVTADLDHPNIVPVYDLASDENGELFYSMKRVQGTPWLEVIEQKSLAENLEILMKVADAVAFAHSREVVHRDLKPENVMLGDFGEVLVMDWGIALTSAMAIQSDEADGFTSAMGGTPAYMAPEMATGPIHRIGPASDVYLLGALLYEMITGQPPHTGRDILACLQAAAENIIQPTDHSGELMDIARRAMATNPDDRHSSVREFQQDIRDYESHTTSIEMSNRADEDLKRARKSRDYQDFAHALFAFEEAASMWIGNTDARIGVTRSKIAYAEAALRNKDFDLGLSLLSDDNPQYGTLRRDLVKAQKERDARQQRLKRVRLLSQGLAASIFIIVVGALVIIGWQMSEVRKKELVALKNAKVARINERQARENAANFKLARQDALNKGKIAERATIKAVSAQAEAVREKYNAQIGLCAELVTHNAFDSVNRILADLKAKGADNGDKDTTKRFEWRRLHYLSNLPYRADALRDRIESVAVSPTAGLAVAAAREGKFMVWNTAPLVEKMNLTNGRLSDFESIMEESMMMIGDHGGDLHCAAISPNGRYVVTAGASFGQHASDIASADSASPRLDGVIKIWDLKSETPTKPCFVVRRHDDSNAIDAISTAEASVGGEAESGIDSGLGQPAGNLDFNDTVTHVAFSKDERGTRLISASRDMTARVWKISYAADETISGIEQDLALVDHRGTVWCAEFSPREGNDEVLTAADDGVRIWDLQAVRRSNAQSVRDPDSRYYRPYVYDQDGPAYTAIFSNDGRYVASAGESKEIHVWEKRFNEDVRTPASRPGEEPIAAEDGDDPAKEMSFYDAILEAAAKKKMQDFLPDHLKDKFVSPDKAVLTGHTSAIRSLAFSDDGGFLISGADDNSVIVWQPKNNDLGQTTYDRKILRGHGGRVRACALLDANGRFIVSGGHDEYVNFWDWKAYAEYRSLEGHKGAVLSATISPDGMTVVTGGSDGNAGVWDLATGRPVDALESSAPRAADGQLSIADGPSGLAEGHLHSVVNAAFFPDGETLVTIANDTTARKWDCRAGGETFFSESVAHLEDVGLKGNLAISRNGKWILTGGTDRVEEVGGEQRMEIIANVWDAESGENLAELLRPQDTLIGPESADGKQNVSAVAFSPDNRRIGIGYDDGTAIVWLHDPDAANWKVETVFNRVGRESVLDLRFLPNDALLIANEDGSLKQWDLASGQHIENRAFYHTSPIRLTRMSPDGLWMLTYSDDLQVRILELSTSTWTFQEVSRFRIDGNTSGADPSDRNEVVCVSADWTPDSKKFATLDGNHNLRIHQRDAPAASLEQKSHLRGAPTCLRYAPHGRYLVITGLDKAKLWSTQTGELVQRFSSHRGVTAVATAESADLVATASEDGSVKLWRKSSTGRRTVAHRMLRPHDGFPVNSVAIRAVSSSLDQFELLTAGDDKRAVLWQIDLSAEDRYARERVVHRFDGDIKRAMFTREAEHTASRVITIGPTEVKIWDPDGGNHIVLRGVHSRDIVCADYWEGLRVPEMTIGSEESQETDGIGSDQFAGIENTTSMGRGIDSEQFPVSLRMQSNNDEDNTLAPAEEFRQSQGRTPKMLRRLVTGGEDNIAVVWDIDTGQQVASFRLRGHTAAIMSVAYSPDGNRILTGSQDKSVKVWNAISGSELMSLEMHDETVAFVDFTPEKGQDVVTASHDGKAIIWLASDPDRESQSIRRANE